MLAQCVLSEEELHIARSQNVCCTADHVTWPERPKPLCCLSLLQQKPEVCSLLGGVCLALTVTLAVCATLMFLAMLPGTIIVASILITLASLTMVLGILLAWLILRYQNSSLWKQRETAWLLFSTSVDCQAIASCLDETRILGEIPNYPSNERRTKIRDLTGCARICHHLACCLTDGVQPYTVEAFGHPGNLFEESEDMLGVEPD